MMVWDTDLIYQYYRLVQGNRLIIGTSSLRYTYTKQRKDVPKSIIRKMYKYLNTKFPDVSIKIDYVWPGLIGVSKDFLPILGVEKNMKNVYYAGASAGLPWAAALGEYLADKIFAGRNEFDKIFSPDRKFTPGAKSHRVLTKPLSFALSHGIKKYLN